MPFPNEHAARVRDPGDFDPDSFRRKKITDGVSIIVGKLKGKAKPSDPVVAQSYRFDKSKFTAAEARAWLKRNKVKVKLFEPAQEAKGIDMADNKSIELMDIPEKVMSALEGEMVSLRAIYPLDGFVVVRDRENNYQKVSLTFNGDDTITLADRGNWEPVTMVWVAAKELEEALKVGARHSKDDNVALQSIHDAAVKLGAMCDGKPETKAKPAKWQVGAARDLPIEKRSSWDGPAATSRIFAWAGFDGDNPDPVKARQAFLVYDSANPDLRGSYKLPFADVVDGSLRAIDAALRAAASRLPQSDIPADIRERARGVLDGYFEKLKKQDGKKEESFYAVKALDEDGKIGAYAVRFGSEEEPDLSEFKDYFTQQTDFWLDKWDKRPMLYAHAQDEEPELRKNPVVGLWTSAKMDKVGVWLEGQIEKSHKYWKAIWELVKRKKLALSSDSAPHLVLREKGKNGTHKVTRWPLVAASLTPTPAEPRLLPAEEIKAAYKAVGIEVPTEILAKAESPKERARKAKAEWARKLRLELGLLELA